MPASKSADRAPSTTSLTLNALVAADDLLTPKQIAEATGRKVGPTMSALRWMYQTGAVDFVSNNGQTFWLACPALDKRKFVIDERLQEDEARVCGKRSARKPKNAT